jgi:hypothetical protein
MRFKRIGHKNTEEYVSERLRKLHDENLCSSPSIIGTIKSRRMRWAGHVARMRRS